MNPVEVAQAGGLIVLGMPHTGTWMPEDVRDRLNARGRLLADTDWHVDRLYDRLLPEATTVRATFHRYLVDANRDPSGASLYPGRNTTTLVPLTDFDGEPIWTAPPDDGEVVQRREAFHAPYHAALAAEVERVRARHGIVVLYDCHSIRSRAPFLFDGRLPDLNIGTNCGASCAPRIARAAEEVCASDEDYTTVVDGRFKGGWTTRAYGRPREGVHAIQMELAQITYLVAESPPFGYDPVKAGRLRETLGNVLRRLEDVAHELGGPR